MNSLAHRYLNVNGQLLDLSVPQVMGILNVTPDSFYAGSRMQTEADILLTGFAIHPRFYYYYMKH